MMASPKISVVTVVFNGEDHIGRTIASVIHQTYKHIEYIIIDGKSTDKTLDVIAGYKGVDLLVSEPDKGLYDAMNKGLSAATGDYVWFLNSGDEIYDIDTVGKMVEGLEGMPYNLNYRLSADIDWAIRAAKNAVQIHNTRMILSRFLEGGLTRHNIKAGLKERFKIMRRFYGLFPTVLRHFLFGARLTNYYLRNRRF